MSTTVSSPISSVSSATRGESIRVAAFFAAWLALATAASFAGVLDPDRMFLVPTAVVGGSLALAALYRTWPALRAVADRVDLRVLLAIHTLRLPVGIAFLVLESRGELDPTFAARAGWGDILAGALAVLAMLAVPVRSLGRRRFVRLFNVVGLLDILMVVATAQWILFASGHPETLSTMTAPPWAVIPLFLVPTVIATHGFVWMRLRRSAPAG